MIIGAGEFKAKCLKLIDDVDKYHEEIVITKRGVPKARVVPISATASPEDLWGYMQGSVKIKGDIISPLGEQWDADR